MPAPIVTDIGEGLELHYNDRMFHAPDLLHALSDLRLAHPIYLVHQISSTNDQARQMAEAGAPEGLLLVAEEQTAGRGRAGRRWLTPPGTALALSLVLRPTLPAALGARLTMLAGVAACEAVELVAGVRASLKWPNDVLIGGRKAGGILVESALRDEDLEFAVLGLGLNVSWAPPPEQVDYPATCVDAEAGRAVDRLKLLRALLAGVEARYSVLAGPALFDDWRARLETLGRPVVVQMDSETWTGQAEAVEADGALLVRTEAGALRRVLAGDVRVRPGP